MLRLRRIILRDAIDTIVFGSRLTAAWDTTPKSEGRFIPDGG